MNVLAKSGFVNWPKFRANKQPRVIKFWLRAVRSESATVFARGMLGRHSGQVRRKKLGGGRHVASTPSEFPANDSGALLASLKTRQTSTEVVIGTTAEHGKWLREGTQHMKRRRMSDTALKRGGIKARPKSKGWAQWERTKKNRPIRKL